MRRIDANSNIIPELDRYDIILINLPSKNYSTKRHNEHSYKRSIPPLGLGYIATHLKNKNLNVGLIDAELKEMSLDSIINKVKSLAPKFIGINCYTTNLNICYEIINRLANTDIKIIVGGPHLLGNPTEFCNKYPKVISVVGFGEKAIYDIMNNKTNGHIVENFTIEKNILNSIVDHSFFENTVVKSYGFNESVMIGSRGCFKRCKYCITNKFPFIYRDMGSIVTEIEKLIHGYNTELIHFLDDLCFPTNERLKEFISSVKNNEIYDKFLWRGLCSIDTLKNLDLRLLEKSNCIRLSIGVESGSNRMLKFIGKNYNKDDIVAVLSELNKTGIKTKLFFMIGLPTETSKDIEETKELLSLLKKYDNIDEINIFQFKPYPGTELYNNFFKNEKIDYVYEDLRVKPAEGKLNFDVEKSLGKDFYFSKNTKSSMNLQNLQRTILNLTVDFYKRGKEECREKLLLAQV